MISHVDRLVCGIGYGYGVGLGLQAGAHTTLTPNTVYRVVMTGNPS